MAPLRKRPAPMVALTPDVIQKSRMTNRPPTPNRPQMGLRRPPVPPPVEEYFDDEFSEDLPPAVPRAGRKMQIQSLKDLVDADEGLPDEVLGDEDLLEIAAAAAGFDGIIGESAVYQAREECKASGGIVNALRVLRIAVYQMSKAMAISNEAIDIARLSFDIVVQSAAITLLAALADRDDIDENFIP